MDNPASDALLERDFFTDHSVLLDPYDYFEELRAYGPVHQLKKRDLLVVTGFKEAVEILLNTADFSSLIASSGPVIPLPFEAEGDDISGQIEAYRRQLPATALMVNYDDEMHTAARSLLNPLLVPSRLKANEEFMWSFADEIVRDAVAKGDCEIINKIATPFVTLVIADLLGVPEADRNQFREVIDAGPPPGNMDDAEAPQASQALEFMVGYFARYLQERRLDPRDDVMTQLALAKYPDGSTPDIMEPAKAAMFLFAAGQDTRAKLIGNSMRLIAEDRALQTRLREDRSLIAPFVEEMLRLEGSVKATFRLARRKTRIGDTEIPAGKKIVVALAAANRDPQRWEEPNSLKIGRPKIKEHIGFGRGAHTCAGAPLARVEVRVLLERFFEHTSEIALSEAHHGPPENRSINYEPSYLIRGLDRLYLDLKPR